jgi:uncharacterized protein (TIGR00255 family)
MTGYGSSTLLIGNRDFSFEIKGVNNRYLDVRVHLPRDYYKLENDIKEKISSYVNRGKVDLYINYKTLPEASSKVDIDKALVKEYYGAIQNIADDFDYDDDISLQFILSQPNVMTLIEPEIELEEEKVHIINAVALACEEFVQMRENEATNLIKSIKGQLDSLSTEVDKVEKRSSLIVDEYKQKLEQRIKELLSDSVEVDQDRLANEVAYYADKAGIDEEIVRVHSHVDQFNKILKEDNKIGRKLDFLVQEFNREINTIGSKSSDVTITNSVVEMKSIIEKIREQVQNLE